MLEGSNAVMKFNKKIELKKKQKLYGTVSCIL